MFNARGAISQLYQSSSKDFDLVRHSDWQEGKFCQSEQIFVSPNNFCYFATFSCFRFTPGLAFGEKDIGHPAITEYLSLTGQGKLQNRKIISERKQPFNGNSLPVQRTDNESIFVGLNIFLWANPTKPTLFRNWHQQITHKRKCTETSKTLK